MHSWIQRKLFAGAALAGLAASPLVAAPAPAKASGRPYLGMAAETVAKDATPNGVTVHSVTPEGPAGKAGLKSSDQIGFFGVGFKSVYEICERPQVYYGPFAFEIADQKTRACKERIRTLRDQLEIARSLGASLRSEWAASGYQT